MAQLTKAQRRALETLRMFEDDWGIKFHEGGLRDIGIKPITFKSLMNKALLKLNPPLAQEYPHDTVHLTDAGRAALARIANESEGE